ncbi:MAG TPA: hypothetical protein VM261_36810 [Kofleriaceae bacterium]|nr:hypothetical protein [Kofleriaceae bacterium]
MSRGPAVAGMMSLVVCGVLAGSLSGCLLDPYAGHRPARFHVGPNTRAVSVPTAAPGGATSGAARTTSPTPQGDTEQLAASTVSLQFTMQTPHAFYTGIEAETGRLHVPLSNVAAAYGVVGLEQDIGLGSLGAEIAAGWQSIRYKSGDAEHETIVVEPRLRGQLWIAEQWTVGATMGARLDDDGDNGWMAGAYLGVHSARF